MRVAAISASPRGSLEIVGNVLDETESVNAIGSPEANANERQRVADEQHYANFYDTWRTGNELRKQLLFTRGTARS